MNVLQPLILAGLPLITLPIIIHLINQRRFQTIRWGAMMFLLAANRMSRGYARLRQWLILAFRMLAIAGLIFALSRPLASGWLGLTAGGRADTTIIVLDRSSSMQQQAPGTSRSKLKAGVEQLTTALNLLGSGRWVLIESQAKAPRDLEKPSDLEKLPAADPTSASADVAAMLETARDYIRTNKTGRTEIWICSDLRENDWNQEGGRWSTLRDAFLEFPQSIRFHLLAYAEAAPANVAVRVTGARRQRTATGAELLLSLTISRESAEGPPRSMPVQIELEGARSEVTVELAGAKFELKDHPIPLDAKQERGWGKVTIPADNNPGDNEAFFVFDQPPVRQTVIVTDDPNSMRSIQLAASVTPDPSVTCQVEVLTEDQLAPVDWANVALVVWHAPLPTGDNATTLQTLIERGGQVLFLPPEAPGTTEFLGVRWDSWTDGTADGGSSAGGDGASKDSSAKDGAATSGGESSEGSASARYAAVESWRGDQDLLEHTQSGAPLPVGEIQVRRWCGLQGEFTSLGTLSGGKPLLARVPTTRGGAYWCTTTPSARNSSLAANGIVLYVMLQRALAAGAAVLGDTRGFIAGEAATENTAQWQQLAGPGEALSTDFAFHRGVYSDGPRLISINRPAPEDHARVLDDPEIRILFQGLDFSRVDDKASNFAALVQEIWRAFLLTMMIALVVEAALCLPKLTRPQGGAA